MEADFSGYATKAGLKCTDGRTIMPDAFKHQDTTKVPLVWQHGHSNPENVLGHAILENREDGVYAYGFFNDSTKAAHTRGLIEHKDITMMSIWANDLIERAGRVLHGAIREVSLVLSGANPGAIIENVNIRHADGDDFMLDDEAIIYTGLSFEHSIGGLNETMPNPMAPNDLNDPNESTETDTGETAQSIYNSMTEEQRMFLEFMIEEALSAANADPNTQINIDPNTMIDMQHDSMGSDATVQDVYDSMNDDQKTVVHFMIGEALASINDGSANGSTTVSNPMQHAATGSGPTVQDIYDSMSKEQQAVCHFMIGQALNSGSDTTAQHDNISYSNNTQEGNEMNHNVFEKSGEVSTEPVISHADMQGILADATRNGSLKDAVESYALKHGIDSIDQLFPEAQNINNTPQFLTRRVEWVAQLLGGVNKSPFSRIKTISANLTYDEARAKGYIHGNLKKEEFFNVTKRVTTPTTIYKKQQLDRDDIVDITDFDVVTWLKGEMRLMLDEEIARAILIGDGRDISDADKINEQNIRPIVGEHELFATTVTINTADTGSTAQEIVDAIIANRWTYKGTGTPTMFCSETTISKFLLLKDTLGRSIYSSLDEVASVLRVSKIVPVEAMETVSGTAAGVLAIIVNPVDYVVGSTAGGQVSMFDFFDIDYNKQKYLIETRASGALTRLKSAIIVKETTNASVVAVVPTAPTFVKTTGVVTIPTVTGVKYVNDATGATLTAGAQTALTNVGDSITVTAYASSTSYYIASDNAAIWTFTKRAS